MEEGSLKNRCKINTNIDTDTFVGISYDNGNISISFPLGYRLSTDDNEVRKDIFLLIRTISRVPKQKKSEIQINAPNFLEEVNFPIQAYLYLIRDYIEHGYYKETESQYVKAKRGKINWTKTIKTQKPFIQEENAFYLDYMIKKNQININELITLIHKFCVYESFQKMGWLFTEYMPEKPQINFRPKWFVSVIKEKSNHTFNDKNRRLFQNMLAVVMWLGNSHSSTRFTFGTYRFEYVWENMIDRVYGIINKSEYFPEAVWEIDREVRTASLRPDTIMKWNNKIYVLDAKYYKYGQTRELQDLPGAPDINKQITYAEYIAESKESEKSIVYNAFILPFDSVGEGFNVDKPLSYIGCATGNWKSNEKIYKYVYGILLDVKYLMEHSSGHDMQEIERMADEIEKAACSEKFQFL